MTITISVSNIGPIRSASVRLKPLTIFVGPNNTGKSVLATVVYAVLQRRPGLSPAAADLRLRRNSGPLPGQKSPFVQKSLSDDEPTGRPPQPVSVSGEEFDEKIVPVRFRNLLERRLTDTFAIYVGNLLEDLGRCFGTELVDVCRTTPDHHAGHIIIAGETSFCSWKVKIDINPDDDISDVTIEAPDPIRLLPLYLQHHDGEEFARVVAQSDELAADEVAESLAWLAFEGSPEGSWYLPAARSGLLQSHKFIADSLIRRSSAIRGRPRPVLPGIVTDFLSEMVTLDETEEGSFQEAAHKLEQKILHGEVRVVPVPPSSLDIRYRTDTHDLPLQRTSSMVSELAPVVLYLRHLVRRHDLLLIEEPEAHLHPASQIAFAQVVGELVNTNLFILLTTHSELFLKQINNLVSASGASGDTLSRAGVRDDSTISPDNVAAYLFSPVDGGGTDVTELKVDNESGISDSNFFEVVEALYDQSMVIYRDRPE